MFGHRKLGGIGDKVASALKEFSPRYNKGRRIDVLSQRLGRLVSVHRGFYDSVPITSVTSEKKIVDVKKYYNTERLRPIYEFDGAPLFIMTSD